METQGGSNQINPWRRFLNFHAAENNRSCETHQAPNGGAPVTSNPQPVTKDGYARWLLIPESGATSSGDGEHIDDAVLRATAGKDLSINKARIQNAIHARNIVTHQRLQPPLTPAHDIKDDAYRMRADGGVLPDPASCVRTPPG